MDDPLEGERVIAPTFQRSNRMWAGIGIVACVLIAIGAFLPWQTAAIVGLERLGRATVRGWETDRSAKLFVGLAVLAAVACGVVATMRDQLALLVARLGLLAVGAVLLAATIAEMADVRAQSLPGTDIDVGIGLYLSAPCAAVLLAVGVAARSDPPE